MKKTFLSLIIILTTNVCFAQKDTAYITVNKDQIIGLIDGKGQAGFIGGKDQGWYITLFARSFYDGINTPTINAGFHADSTNGLQLFDIGKMKNGLRYSSQPDYSKWNKRNLIDVQYFLDNTDSTIIQRRVTTVIGLYAIDSIKIPYIDTTFKYKIDLVAESGVTDSSATADMTLLIKRNAAGKYIIADNEYQSVRSKSFFMIKLYWFVQLTNGIPYIYVQQFLNFPLNIPANKKYIKWKVSRSIIL